MQIEVKVPEVGESVQEALLAQWYKKDGEMVRKDEILFVIETDKVTLEIAAQAEGVLKILVPEGRTVAIGAVVGMIDPVAAEAIAPEKEAVEKPAEAAPSEIGARPEELPPATEPPPPMRQPAQSAARAPLVSPSVQDLIRETGADVSSITPTGPGGRITKADVLEHLEKIGHPLPGAAEWPAGVSTPSAEPVARETRAAPPEIPTPPRVAAVPVPRQEPLFAGGEAVVRKPMSPIRQRIAQRLLEARQTTAMLTTFNEIDMSRVQEARKRFGEAFEKRHGVRLGIMSFFIRAAIAALREIPEANAWIEGNEIVYHRYCNIGIAVGADRGLVVPVIRNAEQLGLADMERAISDFVRKIKENRLALADLEGGTFTITNGGVYGSLLSTPILNPPQSAILGMHRVEQRPVVVEGQIVIRPMMYVALSYDHRLIDGREAVTFLKRIKECVENPERILMEV